MSATGGLMTVEEYRKLPETGPFYYELHNGELVQVCRPKMKHARRQRRLRKLLEAAYGDQGVWDTGVAFRALPEHELRAADVAYLAGDRWRQTGGDDNVRGAPGIVMEVLSRSNTAQEIAALHGQPIPRP